MRRPINDEENGHAPCRVPASVFLSPLKPLAAPSMLTRPNGVRYSLRPPRTEEVLKERRFPRVSLSVPLFVSVGGGRLFEKAVAIESRDISGGGLCFETESPIPVDAPSKIVVGCVGNLPSSAIIEGRVVYRRRLEGTDRYTIGVEFTDFVNTSRDELLERIEIWQVEPAQLTRPVRE